MLPDYKSKVLRILYNYTSQRHRMPTVHELENKTEQSKQRVHDAILLLGRRIKHTKAANGKA
ncbi:hypothetical protein [Paenibacillus faecalis]|uniref:hypothetical protein n=1 Tax=Paenibacillus faecalis TaxID=2079532 RepID=UPI000D0F806F|nr:hypothetical protein [Paenibacillus faecalis]